MIRWFFQCFQKGVRGLWHQPVSLIDNSKFHLGRSCMHPERSFQFPNLFNENLSGLGFRLDAVKVGRIVVFPLTVRKNSSTNRRFPLPSGPENKNE